MQLNTCSRARESARCAKRGVLLQLKLGGQARQTGGAKRLLLLPRGLAGRVQEGGGLKGANRRSDMLQAEARGVQNNREHMM